MLKVAVGVIKNKRGEVLISKRANDVHQGGLWEFPGGKHEEGEDTSQALERELREELNISVQASTPFVEIKHCYSDVSVHLDVHIVEKFEGEACGMEGQLIKWVAISALEEHSFPAANVAIIEALKLPQYYPIVDECIGDEQLMLEHLKRLIAAGYTMIQLRVKSFSKERFKKLARRAIELCEENEVRLFVNTDIAMALEINARAVHLSVKEMMKIKNQSLLPKGLIFAASCHNKKELCLAKELGALFAVLSPVCKSQTHPDAQPLGWERFKGLAESSAIPVFALGGLGPDDMDKAQSNGAHGVAGIRGF